MNAGTVGIFADAVGLRTSVMLALSAVNVVILGFSCLSSNQTHANTQESDAFPVSLRLEWRPELHPSVPHPSRNPLSLVTTGEVLSLRPGSSPLASPKGSQPAPLPRALSAFPSLPEKRRLGPFLFCVILSLLVRSCWSGGVHLPPGLPECFRLSRSRIKACVCSRLRTFAQRS